MNKSIKLAEATRTIERLTAELKKAHEDSIQTGDEAGHRTQKLIAQRNILIRVLGELLGEPE